MIIRDPWHTETMHVGPSFNVLGAVPGASDQALLQEMHALALTIYQATQDVIAAQARGDVGYVQLRIQDVQRLRNIFQQTAAQFRANDPPSLTAIDRFILATGTWIEQAVKALPGAIAALPAAVVDGLGQAAGATGSSLFKAMLPWVGVTVVLLWLVGRAEGTATGKRLLRA